jgi:hypothetical protein
MMRVGDLIYYFICHESEWEGAQYAASLLPKIDDAMSEIEARPVDLIVDPRTTGTNHPVRSTITACTPGEKPEN